LAATFSAARFSANLARGFLAELTSAKSAQGPEPEDVENAAQPDQPNIVEVAGLAMALPARLQSPSTELTRPGIGACCASIRTIARLSAQASAWHPRPRRVCSLVKDRAPRYPKERVAEYSNAICLLIRAATIGQGAGFLDLRPAIRAPAHATFSMALATSNISIGKGWKCWGRR
jgi:hypothetical protein